MTQPTREIRIDEYDYDLPEARIARYPLPQRDSSKLLVYNNGNIEENVFTSLPDYIPAGSLMVFNNTKVIQARLHFRKPTGALIEIFCLEPAEPADYEQSFAARGRCVWSCLVGNKKKWKEGCLTMHAQVSGRDVEVSAEIVGTQGTDELVAFSWNDEALTFGSLLEAIGELPIPPYLNRKTEEADKQTYQTVYSKTEGSVAAPTAGLHFTENVLGALDAKGVERAELTLHVGAGTFRPVKSEHIADHTMHAEHVCVERSVIDRLIAHNGHCTAVGTTSVRTLESLYYLGVMVAEQPQLAEEALHVPQWMPYDHTTTMTSLEALRALANYMDANRMKALHATTQIIIADGYNYHIVERMVTNFHMPKSTLLLLVSAFIGNDWREVYRYALGHDFRFLSYGDSSLLIPKSHD